MRIARGDSIVRVGEGKKPVPATKGKVEKLWAEKMPLLEELKQGAFATNLRIWKKLH